MKTATIKGAWNIFLLFSGLYIIAYFYRVSVAVIADDLLVELKLSVGQLGSMSAALFFAFAFMQLPLGPLLDRYGPRWIVGVCGLVTAAGAFLFASAESYQQLYCGRFLIGAGTAAVLMGSLKAYTEWFVPQMFATLTGLQVALGNAGSLLGTKPLAWAATEFGWRNTFSAVGLLTVAWTLLLIVTVRNGPFAEESDEVVPSGDWRHLFFSLDFWRFSLLAFFWYGSYMAVQGLWGIPYLTNVLGLSRDSAATLLMFSAIGFIIGCPLTGQLSDRWLGSRRRVLLPTQVVFAGLLCGFLGGLEHLPEVLLPVFFFLFGLMISSGPLLFAQIKEKVPLRMAATAMTAVNFFVFLGAALLQQLMGMMVDDQLSATGLHRAFILPVIGLILAWFGYLGCRETDS